jgi:hypothetical protein
VGSLFKKVFEFLYEVGVLVDERLKEHLSSENINIYSAIIR